MKPEPIETAPKDREILVYGEWGWESTDNNLSEPKWKVAEWRDYVGVWDEETFEHSGGFSSITENPYADYTMGIYWCELPEVTNV